MKTNCLKPEICKIEFPIASLEKYIDRIQEKDYSYIAYFYNKELNHINLSFYRNLVLILRIIKNNKKFLENPCNL